MLNTKIVCTLGPTSSSREVIRGLVEGGMDMARINMSHGDQEGHAQVIRRVRAAAGEAGKPVAILVDLQGPKLRVGDLDAPRELIPGESVVFAPEGIATGDDIPASYEHLASDLAPGEHVLVDDGMLELECVSTEGDRVHLRVVRGGMLKSRKGMNLPGVHIREPSLTEKDLRDLDFALEHEAAWVGLSFVRSGEDVADLKRRLDGRAMAVAKIERREALDCLEDILCETDAVMVARGDLGVELPFQQIPMAQKRIIQMANYHARPVITATQMLESMIVNARPTRAEVSDVANAIMDGTDAVMLSGETAIGRHPVQVLAAMVKITEAIEGSPAVAIGPRYDIPDLGAQVRSGATRREHAVAAASVESTRVLGAPAMVVITRSGFTARLLSSYRCPVPIFAVCTEVATARMLCPVWGVRPVLSEGGEVSYESLTEVGRQAVLSSGVGQTGDPFVVTSGFPFHRAGTTNTMRVEVL